MALRESERQDVAELLLISLPRLSKGEQAEIEKAWADETISRAEALERGDLTTQDGATSMAELRAELRTVRSKRYDTAFFRPPSRSCGMRRANTRGYRSPEHCKDRIR